MIRSVQRRFALGDRVRIVRLLDSLTTPALIGHEGKIEEFDAEAWPLIANYEMDCGTCGSSHYVHDAELEAIG